MMMMLELEAAVLGGLSPDWKQSDISTADGRGFPLSVKRADSDSILAPQLIYLRVDLLVYGGVSVASWSASDSSGRRDAFCTDGGPLLQLVYEGDFKAVLLSSVVQGLLGGLPEEDDSIEVWLERQVLSYLSNSTEDQRDDRETVLLVLAVGCLNIFVQGNWTRPPVELRPSDLLPEALQQIFSQLNRECVYSLMSNPLLLLLTRVILIHCGAKPEGLQNHQLSNDTVLNQINLADPSEHQIPELTAEEQALILAICTDFQENNSVRRLNDEELLAFTTTLMDFSSERTCDITERLKMFYACRPPPLWDLQRQLASLLTDLGLTSSALLIYERLELWEEAVI